MAQRVPRTRANNTMTEAQYWGKLRSALRNAYKWWAPIKEAKLRARRPSKRKRLKWEYQCAQCKKWFPDKEVQVDHIVPCGSLRSLEDIAPFFEKLTCEVDGFQVLCKDKCHAEKTKREREARK